MLEMSVSPLTQNMKSRIRKMKKTRRPSPLRRVRRLTREPKEPTLLEKIAQITDELQLLRSKLANAGDDLPAVGTHPLAALEAGIGRILEVRPPRQGAALAPNATS